MCRVSSVTAAAMRLLPLLLATAAVNAASAATAATTPANAASAATAATTPANAASAATAATAGANAVSATAAAINQSNCERLANSTTNRPVLQFGVSYGGKRKDVLLVWGSEPAHAAAALLGVLLRHVHRFNGINVSRTAHPHDTAALATSVDTDPRYNYKYFIIAVSTAWEPKPAPEWVPNWSRAPGLAGPRLVEYGASVVPVRRRLFAWVAPPARSTCQHPHVRWLFYANVTALESCYFFDPAKPQNNTFLVYVLGDDKCDALQQRLQQRAKHSGARLHLQRLSRAGFDRSLQPQHSANRSFLFLDYDMWHEVPGVSIVEPPPCESVDTDCTQELDTAIAMRVADINILQVYAAQLLKIVHDFQPSPDSLRQILEQQASGIKIEEAACDWVLKNNNHVISDKDKREYHVIPYEVCAWYCNGDSEKDYFTNLTNIVQKELEKYTHPEEWNITIWLKPIQNCSSDKNSISKEIENYAKSMNFLRLLGFVLLSAEGTVEASSSAADRMVPVVLADVVSELGTKAGSTWRLVPRPRHFALALLHFVRESNWTRVAVLSEPSELAKDYYAALQEAAKDDERKVVIKKIVLHDSPITTHAKKVLQELKDVKARIVFINADARAAGIILTAAVADGMGYADGFVWIVRDSQHNDVNNTTTFTVSSYTRGEEDIPGGEGNDAFHKKLNNLRKPWPPRAVSFIDALVTLVLGYKYVFQQFPDMRQDLRNHHTIRSLQERLISKPVTGVSQQLRFKERSIEETLVFVDQWRDGNITRLARWRVNATSGAVRGQSTDRAALSPPRGLPLYDGASGCIVRSGDEFSPRCHDILCICVLLLVALLFAVALLARRALRRRFARLQQEQQIQAIARRRHVATVLAAYLVERTALELHEELGAGRFGSVRLARLRVPARAPRYIAAKALRENAAPTEESEFLREACTIASLEHAHIVRLVGVCITDGPPLVLMELAFFGDLLGYLRARRRLVEGAVLESLEAPAACGEAEHVSAAALTRLAREAAEALQYLAVRGVVHRDVRAANCLVDVRRSLKLADFGMARDTVSGADGAPEYACRRRGLFPVLWMAPESLAHGVFSAASDVWALGVLVLELVTLGRRPYGAMSPLRVLEYVATGGSPPLPLDATPKTRGLARLCWAHAAERRPSAAEVAAYLAAWPLALRPALLSECDEPADADSGFGVSPSTELLPPDSPRYSLDQFDELAATH